jgi:hypothetical protein
MRHLENRGEQIAWSALLTVSALTIAFTQAHPLSGPSLFPQSAQSAQSAAQSGWWAQSVEPSVESLLHPAETSVVFSPFARAKNPGYGRALRRLHGLHRFHRHTLLHREHRQSNSHRLAIALMLGAGM